MTAPAATPRHAAANPRHSRRTVYVMAGGGAVLAVVLVLLRLFAYQLFDARSGSMQPTIGIGDLFVVTKLDYAPARGDVVAFRAAGKDDKVLIKRIVGMPGDRIQLKGGILFINGAAVPRRRIGSFQADCVAIAPCNAALYEETLPGGRTDRVLDLGETTGDDTGVFAVPAGAYFVLGDNRDNSLDSRFGQIGFVARDTIVGRAAYRYFAAGRWVWQRID